MQILVMGGTRFMGRHLVEGLLAGGHRVTLANRGQTPDPFGHRVQRLRVDRSSADSIKAALGGREYDVIADSLAYGSNDVKNLLQQVNCRRYVFISSTAVYDKRPNLKEEDFDPLAKPLVWCDRDDVPYDEGKRQAECAAAQCYAPLPQAAVRLPFVVGTDDYTKRLYRYVDSIIRQTPLQVDNLDAQMAFVRSDEAGRFLSFLAGSRFSGAINGASEQTISIGEIAEYVHFKTGKALLVSAAGEVAPYNGEAAYSINVDKAKGLGFAFSPLKSWIYGLLDAYIEEASG